MAEWCEDERLLASLCAFLHLPASQLRSVQDVHSCYRMFGRFVHSLQGGAQSSGTVRGHDVWPAVPAGSAAALRAAAAAAASASVTWLPDYGCALLSLGPLSGADTDIRASLGDLTVLLVGLDKWEFRVHSYRPSSSGQCVMQHTAVCSGHTPLRCGTVAAAEHGAFVRTLQATVEARRWEREKLGQKGYQRTPAFVHACILDTLAGSSSRGGSGGDSLPRGGFTDVGQHTGGVPRDTAWSLVWATMQVLLEHGGFGKQAELPAKLLFQQARAHFHLWLLQRQVQLINPSTATLETLSACMQMLRTAGVQAVELSDDGHDMAAFEQQCHSAQQRLVAAAAQRALTAGLGLQLPEVVPMVLPGSYSLPTGVLPAAAAAQTVGSGLAAARLRAGKNLGSLPLLPLGSSFTDLLALLKALVLKVPAASDVGAQLVLRSVERELWRRAAAGFDQAPLSLVEVAALELVVDTYRATLAAFLRTAAPQACTRVQLYSREVLVAWVAYCLMHAAAGRQHPLTLHCGVGLRWADLQHLVLGDKAGTDAALAVGAYLRAHAAAGRELFSLSGSGHAGTLDFARDFARADSRLQGIWREEETDAQARTDGHWKEVLRKQHLARQLRQQLAQHESQKQHADERLAAAQVALNGFSYRLMGEYGFGHAAAKRRLEACRSEADAASGRVSATLQLQQSAEVSPPPVIQPLPSSSDAALQWLFFLHMPPLLRHLSRATFVAQQLLLPRTTTQAEVVRATSVVRFPTSLTQHYNGHQRASQYHRPPSVRVGEAGRVLLMSRLTVPRSVGPPHVDQCTSPQVGVWHPDTLAAEMGWQGSGSATDAAQGWPVWFNPFAPIQPLLTVLSFTEQLPAEGASLQWAMHQGGSAAAAPADRGNQGVARQDERPRWLSKPGFLALTALRSYPNGQMRRLAAALHERTLSLEHPAVGALVWQALCHLGELTDSSPPSLLWRTDWQRGDMLPTLCAELEGLADELAQTPRQHEAVQLLGEMATFLAGWHAPCRAVARRFSAMTQQWADELEADIAAASGKEQSRSGLQAKQCHLRMVSLLCYGSSELDAEDAAAMVALLVLVKYGFLFFTNPAVRQQLEALCVRCHDVMAGRIDFLQQLAQQHPQLVLTGAVRRILQRTPNTLPWQRLAADASYEAVGSDGRLYSINLLDGTVLLDGSPPGQLPKDIRQHLLYVRTFGRINFEVALTSNGTLQTLQPVGGRLYDFLLTGAGALVVTELDVQQHGVPLELLDVGQDGKCGKWGAQLPVRLQELHSHWLCRERAVIVLRPKLFTAHSTHFLVHCLPAAGASAPQALKAAPVPQARRRGLVPHACQSGGGGGGNVVQLVCRRVPPHLQSTAWTHLLSHQDSEMLVLLQDSRVTQVLAKFEDTAFVHTYLSGAAGGLPPPQQQRLLYELPRYGLHFELQDGALVSQDYSGCHLCQHQQLVVAGSDAGGQAPAAQTPPQHVTAGSAHYLLPEFQQYLVLQQGPGSPGSAADLGGRLVLVPAGAVVVQPIGGGGRMHVELSSACGAALQAHRYEVHPRFGHLQATSITARLLLAALHTGTSSLLPEPRSQLTGAQRAMELLRQCWGNQPLSPGDSAQLRRVGLLGGHLAAGLQPLAHELELSARSLRHLSSGAAAGLSAAAVALDPDAGTAYLQHLASRPCLNSRMALTWGEEERAMGTCTAAKPSPAWLRRGHFTAVAALPPCTVTSSDIAAVELRLSRLVQTQAATAAACPPYPLGVGTAAALGSSGAAAGVSSVQRGQPASNLPLAHAMHAELRDSWETHHCLPVLDRVCPGATTIIAETQAQVQRWRSEVESHVRQCLSDVPSAVGCHGCSFRLLRCTGAAPSHGLLDLARLALQPPLLHEFHPFLSDAARREVQESVLVWLQLCVLEDRLARLVARAAGDQEQVPLLIQELRVRRTWGVAEHPEWLVFEVEGQLQIRPNQHWIADHLIRHLEHGAIDQLNMGEGKTRVILPMLALHWAKGDRLVRLNFLTTLIDEAYAHLHLHMCASVLGRKLFRLPFHRDVELTEQSVRAMRACLTYCQQEGGLLLVAPEHRLSLQLKWHELRAKGQQRTCSALDALAALPYLDVLDESDELLHHRWQLIYACGTATQLPAREARVHAIQALLRIMSCHADGSTIGSSSGSVAWTLTSDGVAAWASTRRPGAFSGLRLLPGEKLEAVLPRLHRQLAEALLAAPPHSLRWLRDHPLQDCLLKCITDSSTAADALMGTHAADLTEEQTHHVLALRGLLAYDTLQHCLQKRHNVEYGVFRSPAAKKRLAVPFRAAGTPAERSEYAQPDVALLLTNLAYYWDGLSHSELLDALTTLLSMGGNAQRTFYEDWLQLSRGSIAAEDLQMVDDVAKLDTTNAPQMDLMWRCFSHNMAAVDFWLDFCVLPDETQQFPQRLASSAWHLAHNPRREVVAFSGTNDNHRLLPLLVRQHSLDELSLRATNGKMLALMLSKDNETYRTLAPNVGKEPAWRDVLDMAVGDGLDALLDCGALLAGVNNKDAAKYLLERLDKSRFQGVCFFDAGAREWVVLDPSGRCLPRHSSPIKERQAFVLFDEARCRGADLQLRPAAAGLLTLGPSTCKDKLMQAAGRLRQLGRGQSLRCIGTPDVTNRIRRCTHTSPHTQLTSCHVLQWVMANTVQATLGGVVEWARQGLHFATTHGAPDRALTDEVVELQALYGIDRAPRGVGEVVRGVAQAQLRRCGSAAPAAWLQKLAGEIQGHSAECGQGHTVAAHGGGDEECERQLEKEQEEEEEEVEVEVTRVAAAAEVDWHYPAAWSAASPAALPTAAGVTALSTVAQSLQPASVRAISWSSRVHCTRNFLHATMQHGGTNEYMRPVDAVLLFPSGDVLLVSEREADALLQLAWRPPPGTTFMRGPSSALPLLMSVCYAQAAAAGAAGSGAPRLAVAPGMSASTPTDLALMPGLREALVSAQLFNGQATYCAGSVTRWQALRQQPQFRELHRLMRRRGDAAETLVGMRGKQKLLPCSQLELACDDAS